MLFEIMLRLGKKLKTLKLYRKQPIQWLYKRVLYTYTDTYVDLSTVRPLPGIRLPITCNIYYMKGTRLHTNIANQLSE